jgi:hypothetical protein
MMRRSHRVDEVKSTAINDLKRSVTPNVEIRRTSETFRQKSPRARSAITSRPISHSLSSKIDIDKKAWDTLNAKDYSKERSNSPMNVKPRVESGQFTVQEKEEALKRAESTRIRQKR